MMLVKRISHPSLSPISRAKTQRRKGFGLNQRGRNGEISEFKSKFTQIQGFACESMYLGEGFKGGKKSMLIGVNLWSKSSPLLRVLASMSEHGSLVQLFSLLL